MVACAQTLQQFSLFRNWASSVGSAYSGAQGQSAFSTWSLNMASITKINTDPTVSWWASANKFANLSSAQFASTYLMQNPPPLSMPSVGSAPFPTSIPPQTDVNWVSSGMVTPVRDQGSCGSCWAFAATSVIESMYLITNQGGASASNLSLSPQHLISCANSANGFYSMGCAGGRSDEVS